MLLLLAILLLVAIFSTKLSASLGIPGLVIFLALGMVFGSDGLNLIYFDNPFLSQQIAIAFMIIILFEGGFNTKKHLLRLAFQPAFTLATLGIIITAVTLGLLSHLLIGLPLESAILIGAIISSTDAAAVFAIFRNKNVQPKTAATLEVESASNDPMAIILTIAIIEFIQGGIPNPQLFIINLGWQIVAGLSIGFIIGKMAPYMFNWIKLESGGFYYVLILSLCLLSYGLADELHTNGFLSVFIAGCYLGNAEFVYKQGVARFMEGLSTFSHVMLFLMLGLLVFPTKLMHNWQHGIIIALVLIFVARPVAVFLCTLFWKYTFKEKLFLCWGGIKGAIPIVLATYPYVAGLEGGSYYFNVVFFVVLLSALIQGSTIDIIAKKLGLLVGSKPRSPYSFELIALEESKSELLEYIVDKDSWLIDQTLQDIPLPQDSLVNAIVRQGEIVTPRGDTIIKAKDILFILVRFENREQLINILEKSAEQEDYPVL
ncbi:MAG: potassium/proton antiporter [Syntrophomonadaceae bacterium]|jgi:cell volume regulation protein A